MARKLGKHTPYFELVDAHGLAGCPICRLIYKATNRYLDSILYEAVLDPDVRTKLKGAQGFCSEHITMLRRKPGRALGVALIYRDIIRSVCETTAAAHHDARRTLVGKLIGKGDSPSAAKKLKTEETCPACVIERRAEQSMIELLIAHIDDEKLYAAYSEGEGLCIPHLIAAIEQCPDENALRRLVEPQVARYEAMLRDLDEFIRKRDHRFRHEKYGEEGDVWLRAMNAIAGGSGMGTSAKWGGRRSADFDSGDH